MKIKFVERRNVTSGRYLAKVTEVTDGTVRSGAECIKVKFVPYDGEGEYEPLYLNLESECYMDSVHAQLFQAIEENIPESVTTKQLKDMFLEETVCLVISDNDVGTKVFHNIVSILREDDYEEEEEEEDEELEEEDEDDEEDEDGLPIWKTNKKSSKKTNGSSVRRR